MTNWHHSPDGICFWKPDSTRSHELQPFSLSADVQYATYTVASFLSRPSYCRRSTKSREEPVQLMVSTARQQWLLTYCTCEPPTEVLPESAYHHKQLIVSCKHLVATSPWTSLQATTDSRFYFHLQLP